MILEKEVLNKQVGRIDFPNFISLQLYNRLFGT